MDLPRRRPDAPRDLARRRLELLGAQLHGLEDPAGDVGPDGEEPGREAARAPWAGPDPRPPTTGRHRAAGPASEEPSAPTGRWPAVGRLLVGDRPVRRQHLLVAALGVVLLALGALWWVAAAQPEDVRPLGAQATTVLDDGGSAGPADAGGPASPPSDPATGAPPPPTTPTEVVVDVAGKVQRPGIVTLPAGSRVADALEAAGGARPGTSLTSVNLARVLVDGEQVVVGLPPVAAPGPAGPSPPAPAGGSPAAGAPGALVDLNTATLEQLDTLPGVGPVTGQAILDHRAEIGRFGSVEELLDVRGIGEATLDELRDLVTAR